MNYLSSYSDTFAILIPGNLERMIDNKEFQSTAANLKTLFEPEGALALTDILDISVLRNIQQGFYLFSALTVVGLGAGFLAARHAWRDLNDENQQNQLWSKQLYAISVIACGLIVPICAVRAYEAFTCLKGIHTIVLFTNSTK